MEIIKIKDDYIKLEQALKLSGNFDIGSDAKYAIKNGEVKVNGILEYQRGKKLKADDTFTFGSHDYKIIRITQL